MILEKIPGFGVARQKIVLAATRGPRFRPGADPAASHSRARRRALEFPGFCNTHGHPDRHYISHPDDLDVLRLMLRNTLDEGRCYRSCSSVPRCEGLANVSGRSPRYDWHAPRVVSLKKNVVCQHVLCCAVSRNNDVCVVLCCAFQQQMCVFDASVGIPLDASVSE